MEAQMEDTPEDQLLRYAKEGSCVLIQGLLQSRMDQNTSLNTNCRCKCEESF